MEVNEISSFGLADETAPVLAEETSTVQNSNGNSWKMNMLDLPKEVIGDLIAPCLFEEIPFLLNLNRQSRADLCQTTALPIYLAANYNAPFLEWLQLDEEILRIEQDYIQSNGKHAGSKNMFSLLNRIKVALEPSDSVNNIILAVVDKYAQERHISALFGLDDFGKYVCELLLRTGGLARFLEAKHLFSSWKDSLVNCPNLSDLIAKLFNEERYALLGVLFDHDMYRHDKFLLEFLKASNTFIPEDLSVARTKPFFEFLVEMAITTCVQPKNYNVPVALIYSKFGPYVTAKQTEMDPKLLHDFNFRYNPTFQVTGSIDEREAALLVAAGRYEDAFKFFEQMNAVPSQMYYFDHYPDFWIKMIGHISPEVYRQVFGFRFAAKCYTDPAAIPVILEVMQANSVSELIRSLNGNSHISPYELYNLWPQFVVTAGSMEDFKSFLTKTPVNMSLFKAIFSLEFETPLMAQEYLKVFEFIARKQNRKCLVGRFDHVIKDMLDHPDVLRFMANSPIFDFNNFGFDRLEGSEKYSIAPEESKSIIQSIKNRVFANWKGQTY